MTKRSINEILKTGHVIGDEACRVFDALREARAVLEKMDSATDQSDMPLWDAQDDARILLKKWDEHD